MDVGVGLLHLVEQHHAVGAAAHRLGQHPALAVADVARRRALQRRDGVRLLELAHVDDDHGVVARVEQLAEHVRRLGLADARRPGEHEDADRLVGVVELGAAGLDALGDRVHRVVLADHPLLQLVGDGEDGLRSRPSPSGRWGCRSSRRRPRPPRRRRPRRTPWGCRPGRERISASAASSWVSASASESLRRGLDRGLGRRRVRRAGGELGARRALVAGQRGGGFRARRPREPRAAWKAARAALAFSSAAFSASHLAVMASKSAWAWPASPSACSPDRGSWRSGPPPRARRSRSRPAAARPGACGPRPGRGWSAG